MRSLAAIELIGVPFDGWGRTGAQARAPAALRGAGLADVFEGDVVVRPDPSFGSATAVRAAGSGLMNEAALLAMVESVHRSVAAAIRGERFPLLYGADCTVLLAAVPALRDVIGRAGLVFVDAHEDTTSLDASPDGEAANMEIGLLLGLTGQLAPEPLRRRLPALEADALGMLGMNDRQLRRELNVASLADRDVLLRTWDEVASDPAAAGRMAAGQAATHGAGWWLHLDVDVLASAELASQRVPGDEETTAGLTWPQLTLALTAALDVGGCRGWSIAIYDPDQDPHGEDARRIVQFVREVAPHLPRGH